MTKKSYRKLIAGHLQWSLVGLIIALFAAFISFHCTCDRARKPPNSQRGNSDSRYGKRSIGVA